MRRRTRHIGALTAAVLMFGVSLGCQTNGAAKAGAQDAEAQGKRDAEAALKQGRQPVEFKVLVEQHGGEVDFVFGDERPFAECHASTIAQAGGTLVCAWFGGTEEKDPDVGIWLSRRVDGKWAAPVRVAKINETAHWNPVLFAPQGEKLYLFFKVGPEIPYWQTYWMHSEDAGETWSAPLELVSGDQGGRGPVKNKPILLQDGTWLAGASTELNAWLPFADRSTDEGKTWSRSENFVFPDDGSGLVGAIQPTLWESAPGKVHALLRTSAGSVVRADSDDGGKTWRPVRRTQLPNNNSGLDCVRLDDGRIFLVYNPIGQNWGARTPLSLALSTDNGEAWKIVAHFESDTENEEAEFSYPAIIRTKEGIAVSYTWYRQRVRAWAIPMAALDALSR